MNRSDVLAILEYNQQEIKQKYKVNSLCLFGSFARDEANPDSDIDLLVEFKQSVGLFEFIALQQYLESLLNHKVDLGTMRSLKSGLKPQVIKEMIRVA